MCVHLSILSSWQLTSESDVSFRAPSTPQGALQLPEEEPDKWDYKKNRYNYRHTSLSTFRWFANFPPSMNFSQVIDHWFKFSFKV